MTRTIDSNLESHLQGYTTKLCCCWRIKRTDDAEKFFTDHNESIVFDGDTYTPISSGVPSALAQTSDLAVDNVDVEMILDSSALSEDDLRAGLYDYAEAWIFLLNYEHPEWDEIKLLYGRFGEVEFKDQVANVELRSLTQQLQQRIGRTYDLKCDADLGDSRCKVVLATYTVTGTVTSVIDEVTFRDSSRSEADDYFKYGKLTWTGGDNNGISMEVKEFLNTNGEFELFDSLPNDISIGDTYSVYRGCDRLSDTCKNTFSNFVNFRGFPDIPGETEVLAGP